MIGRPESGTSSSSKTTSGAIEIGPNGLKAQLYRSTKSIENGTDYSFSGPLTVLIRRPLSPGSYATTYEMHDLSKDDTIELLTAKSVQWNKTHEAESSTKE